jgi:uncharacterized protein
VSAGPERPRVPGVAPRTAGPGFSNAMIPGLMSSPDHASIAGAPCAAPPDLRDGVLTVVGRRLSLLEGRFAVCRLPACAPWPVPRAGPLLSITRTAEEMSVVCLAEYAPRGARVEDGWRALKLEGPIPFQEIGVLSALSGSLAGAGLSLFGLSTFDTDYILVKETDLAVAVDALRRAGFGVDGEGR